MENAHGLISSLARPSYGFPRPKWPARANYYQGLLFSLTNRQCVLVTLSGGPARTARSPTSNKPRFPLRFHRWPDFSRWPISPPRTLPPHYKNRGPLDPLRHSLRSRSPCSPGRVPSNSQAPPSRPFFLPLLNRAQTFFPSALGSRCPCSSSVAAGRSSLHGRAPPQKPLAHPPVHAVHPEDLRRSARHRSVSSD
jgi:hypothetical protein